MSHSEHPSAIPSGASPEPSSVPTQSPSRAAAVQGLAELPSEPSNAAQHGTDGEQADQTLWQSDRIRRAEGLHETARQETRQAYNAAAHVEKGPVTIWTPQKTSPRPKLTLTHRGRVTGSSPLEVLASGGSQAATVSRIQPQPRLTAAGRHESLDSDAKSSQQGPVDSDTESSTQITDEGSPGDSRDAFQKDDSKGSDAAPAELSLVATRCLELASNYPTQGSHHGHDQEIISQIPQEVMPFDSGVSAHRESTTKLAIDDRHNVPRTPTTETLGFSASPQSQPEKTNPPSSKPLSDSQPDIEHISSDRRVESSSTTRTTAGHGAAQPFDTGHSILPTIPPAVPTPGFSKDELKVIESIMFNCLKFNYEFRRLGPAKGGAATTTEIERIRTSANNLANLEYRSAAYMAKISSTTTTFRTPQSHYNETVYWDIILKGAKFIDSTQLPPPKGPVDEFTKEEKEATRRFMAYAGYSMSQANQRRLRRLWKRLHELRQAGVDKVLFYRTNEFDAFCSKYRVNAEMSFLETVQRWERVYGPQMALLEVRVKTECERCLTGGFVLDQRYVARQLDTIRLSDTWARFMQLST